jgi:hypothetical protein
MYLHLEYEDKVITRWQLQLEGNNNMKITIRFKGYIGHIVVVNSKQEL